MLLPEPDGLYHCKDCEYKTESIFAILDHCMMEFKFTIRLSRSHVLDLFALLKGVTEAIEDDDTEHAIQTLQIATLTLLNASEGKKEFDKFMEETFIKEEAKILIDELEGMLRKEDDNG